MEKKTKKSKESSKQTIAQLTETLQRVQAEFENYKKRVDNEKQEFVKYANEDFILSLLPILDSFELALRDKKTCKDLDEFMRGMQLIYSQIVSLLEQKGVKHIETKDQRFDPYKHEALLQEESDKPEGTILEELQKGYTINEKIIRHSKVKVAKKKSKK
jgi:molecular chaperone GrpE